jgi:hypothetical protein
MQTKEAIQFAMAFTDRVVLKAIDEMKDSATTFPTPNGGCHPLWVLGHLALVEGMVPAILFGEKNPAADWEPLFGQNSEAVSNASAYPPMNEVRERYRTLRDRNLKLLQGFSEADLDKPTVAPPKGLEHEFVTYGSTFLTVALHQAMHRGNVTDAKRAAGLVAAAV